MDKETVVARKPVWATVNYITTAYGLSRNNQYKLIEEGIITSRIVRT